MKHFDPKEAKITLLTIEQAKKLHKDILARGKWWWLQSPGNYRDGTAGVRYDGGVRGYGKFIS